MFVFRVYSGWCHFDSFVFGLLRFGSYPGRYSRRRGRRCQRCLSWPLPCVQHESALAARAGAMARVPAPDLSAEQVASVIFRWCSCNTGLKSFCSRGVCCLQTSFQSCRGWRLCSLDATLRELNNLQGFPGRIIQPGSSHSAKGKHAGSVWVGMGFFRGEGRVLLLQELHSHPAPNIMSGSQSVSAGFCKLCAF